jgi:hypothetical protein
MINKRAMVLRATTIALVGAGIVLFFTDSAAAWLLSLAVLGGSVTAVVLARLRSHDQHASFSPDSFDRGGLDGDVINISRIRVAGFGGAGLLVVAILVALEYQLTFVALIAGAIGGLIGGVAAILYRRPHVQTPAKL